MNTTKVYVVLSVEKSIVNSACDDVYVEMAFKKLEDAKKFIESKKDFNKWDAQHPMCAHTHSSDCYYIVDVELR